MRNNLSRHRRAVWTAALVLAAAAIVTAPLTASRAKYVAAGTGSASARIAAWDVIFAPRDRVQNNGAAITYRNINNGRTVYYQEFAVRNNSEVMADFTVWVGYETDDANTPSTSSPKEPANAIRFLTHDSAPAGYGTANDVFPTPVDNADGTWTLQNIKPGETAWARIEFFADDGVFDGFLNSLGARNSHKCKLFFEAVQVD